jgi:cell fate (sporulation/competence/biofilm development) regulator YlbF (YheA/YmcA/DUF963 family)
MARSKKAMEESLKALNDNANEVGLSINQEKTKYSKIKTERRNINRNTNAKMGQHYFERVQTLSFLGSIINNKYVKSNEILTRRRQGNKAFFMNNKFLSSKLTGRQFKMTIYLSTIKPMITYAVETWTLTERDMNYLLICERRILKKNFGPVQERDGWRIRTKPELH